MNNLVNRDKQGNNLKKIFYISMAFSILSSLLVFLSYTFFYDSVFFNVLLEQTGEWPAIKSRYYPGMSLTMSVFLKTAPLYGFVWFLFSIGKVALAKEASFRSMLASSIVFAFLSGNCLVYCVMQP